MGGLVCAVVSLVLSFSAPGVRAEDGPTRVVLASDRVEVAVGKAEKGAIVSLRDPLSGRELVAPSPQARLFVLTLTERASDGSQRIYLSSQDAASVDVSLTEADGTPSLSLQYRDLGGRGVDCTVEARVVEGEPFVRWRLRVDRIADALVLEEVRFPLVVLRAPLEDGREDLAVLGHTKGGLHRAPSAWRVGEAIGAGQPGSMAAQFGCYYDAAGGFTTAAFDGAPHPKSLAMHRVEEGLEVGWSAACFAVARFDLAYEIVTGVFAAAATPTDWRDAADLYKAWAETQPWCARRFVDRPDVPAWLTSGPAMVRFHRGWLAEPDAIDRWLHDYWQVRFPAGTPLIAAFWGWEKVESWVTPDYFPLFPSDDEFRRLAGEVRALGGHVFPWPSGYHYTLSYRAQEDGSFAWDDRERFGREAEAHAVVQRNGATWRVKPSWLLGGENACMCPGDPWTIDWLNRSAEQLAERGADMIQVDQVVGGNFPPCYSTTHGHQPGPGPWAGEVFRTQLETMLSRLRAIDPEAVVCFEEPNEQFIQQAFIQDYRDLEPPWSGPAPERASVFNYLYHEYLPTFQSNPRAGDLRSQAYCLVNGQIPHLIPSREIGPGPLLGNGDFETWRGEVPAGWDKVGGWQGETWNGACAREDGERHGGASCLRLACADGETVQVSRNLPLGGPFHASATYRLSAWLRSRSLGRPNQIGLGALTHDLTSKGSWGLPMPAPEEGWVQRSATFTLPAGADFLRIMMHLAGPGEVLIDDMRLEEIAADGTATEVGRPELPPDHALMHRWVELFAGEGRPYLLHGRMLHPPVVETDGPPATADGLPAVLCNAYRAPDGSEAAILVNATDQPLRATLRWRDTPTELRLAPWEVRLVR